MGVDVVTFGCRLNSFESEVIRREAEQAGLTDAIVINSCAVTNEAVAQARQSIRKLKRERPHARIVVTGCAAQTQSQMFAEMAEVDRVIGNDEKMRGDAWRATRDAFEAPFGIDASEKVAVADIMSVTEMAPHLLDGFERGLPRVFVQVQNGCDHRCTFCIIPYGRGNSRSVPMGAVVDQVRALVERGHAEIVLTGVDLTSYGADLPGAPKLGQLTRQILRHVHELKRLRISSIDSIEADRDLLDVIADDARLMPHLHLSLQSGDDMILKRMKRRHLRQDAIDFCAQVRRLRPDIALGADIIAGFPTETEEMFARSLDLVEECDLTFLHVFPYSRRPGTPAARMPQVEGGAIKERARRLRTAGEGALLRRLDAEVGATREVLIESGTQGRTEHFLPVAINDDVPGAVRRLTVTGRDGTRLVAQDR
ncbi:MULTISPECIES: tRNA (N(6)-L-threonylcarbamoyladenosine(37)-C(2))-methylthiotransferase MtaB [Bradyrhizobium]|jgi:threonylcarbamoyladenosine tRNA methylthiotransferase MtaB|uniref:tRNA (N(6)-L-threonylcarbamoyladenosine(37)-C(2))- methylthiotransferase MtaB n=1 Tax=Bradyrhizobium TaxID=374 RepID=UPI00047FD810|nr:MULTISPECIES: tRNA (N(6)-L-threonylcarbamoyladenosine(37)-C(2))-methylthiotransferase MtaB [Bradyrhizobium]MCS3444762.1 threonylcarbamoyladenosine tRNA methylthiotransferase MtaB [Bradyrhizobium elkanii]MCS3564110.1 threonylcarbamoyladenosine tRNA methylthiotransferase MtaB [Bradyrhizobium elkanii]MCW2146058.1 threonylcarbamoyladenosine tRNA methylthiotransferase MtaB [Bradyrhizobium elkanii]MCW2354869.1 threonylcarbamoyladenosine tRNA methylthiotransferase MtaB [Bradyrhizobium elkanii]MCW2